MRFFITLVAVSLNIGCGSFRQHRPEISVTYQTGLANGQPIWISSNEELPAKALVHATLINQLDIAHGFEVAGLQGPVVLQPGDTQLVNFNTKGPGTLHATCPLHKNHKPAILHVN